MKTGKVFLVGSGPGDPKLITIKGLEAIQNAEVLVYDRLADPSLLNYANQSAEKIYVGKLPDRHTLKQEEINQLLVEKALEGKIVTRLKGGDPSVFGRVGEEALELKQHRIPFEIIPGITSAIAVPAYAGIPITHRDYSSSVAIVAGHEDSTKNETNINWEKLSTATGTLIFLMGLANLQLITDKLISNGRDEDTPVAVTMWGTTTDQRTVVGSLKDIVQKVEEAKLTSPAIITVGQVVTLREELKWFEDKPLFGKRILVTRAKEQAFEMSNMISALGGEAVEFPVIKTIPPTKSDAFNQAVNRLETFDWIIFSSVNGVNYFFAKLKEQGIDIRQMGKAKIVAVGPKTAMALQDKYLNVEALPQEYVAEGILASLEDHIKPGQKVLLPRADIARDIILNQLREKGLEVTEIDAYETVFAAENGEEIIDLLKEKKLNVITFTSSSTVKNFLEALKGENIGQLLDGVMIASIGPITTATAIKLGLNVQITATEYTIPSLIEAIVNHYNC